MHANGSLKQCRAEWSTAPTDRRHSSSYLSKHLHRHMHMHILLTLTRAVGHKSLMTLSILFTTSLLMASSSGRGDMKLKKSTISSWRLQRIKGEQDSCGYGLTHQRQGEHCVWPYAALLDGVWGFRWMASGLGLPKTVLQVTDKRKHWQKLFNGFTLRENLSWIQYLTKTLKLHISCKSTMAHVGH